ncbi:MAG: superoxide dismutase family protein [Planctomycetes bacterium]|nr:superoxide dismutase family protein [Planctomycetota bacterium]
MTVLLLDDDVIALGGEHSILGRALVVHAGEDTFEQPTGAAGARVAFGVIGIAAKTDSAAK